MANEAIKKCPFCSELVPRRALKCRYCGEMLTDYGTIHSETPLPTPKRMSACLILLIVGIGFLAISGAMAAIMIPTIGRVRERVMRPRNEAREAYVSGVCSDVVSAQETYSASHGRYATLQHLSQESLVHPDLARGRSHGYCFELVLDADEQDWSMTAWPARPGRDTKSYYVDSTGDVRKESYTSHSDNKAGPQSPSLWDDWDDPDREN